MVVEAARLVISIPNSGLRRCPMKKWPNFQRYPRAVQSLPGKLKSFEIQVNYSSNLVYLFQLSMREREDRPTSHHGNCHAGSYSLNTMACMFWKFKSRTLVGR